MTTKIEIYNGALGKIGVGEITSLTEDSEQRIKLDSQYDTALEATLESFFWRFAQKRVQLAKDSSSPEFGFENQFILPADCIKIKEPWAESTDPDSIVWEEEGEFILSDEEDFYMIYTFRQENVGKFTPLFSEALEYKLASLVAMPLKNNRTLAEQLDFKFGQTIIKAAIQDAKRRSVRQTKKESTWLNSRTNPVGTFVNVIKVT